MAQSREAKQQIIRDFQRSSADCGSTEVQAAILTGDIAQLTGHCQQHPKDNSSRRGLLKKVAKRRRLMKYLQRNDSEKHQEVLRQLNLKK